MLAANGRTRSEIESTICPYLLDVDPASYVGSGIDRLILLLSPIRRYPVDCSKPWTARARGTCGSPRVKLELR